MTDAQIHAVHDELFGDHLAGLFIAEKIAALLARYPGAVDVPDIFTQGMLSNVWRNEIYEKRGVA